MTPRSIVLSVLTAVALVAACGQKSIPPGTPAPEYEAPVVTPWPPASASAEPVADVPPTEPAPVEDAGAIDAAAPPASDAPPSQQPL